MAKPPTVKLYNHPSTEDPALGALYDVTLKDHWFGLFQYRDGSYRMHRHPENHHTTARCQSMRLRAEDVEQARRVFLGVCGIVDCDRTKLSVTEINEDTGRVRKVHLELNPETKVKLAEVVSEETPARAFGKPLPEVPLTPAPEGNAKADAEDAEQEQPDFGAMNVKQLRAYLKDKGQTGVSKANRADLLAMCEGLA